MKDWNTNHNRGELLTIPATTTTTTATNTATTGQTAIAPPLNSSASSSSSLSNTSLSSSFSLPSSSSASRYNTNNTMMMSHGFNGNGSVGLNSNGIIQQQQQQQQQQQRAFQQQIMMQHHSLLLQKQQQQQQQQLLPPVSPNTTTISSSSPYHDHDDDDSDNDDDDNNNNQNGGQSNHRKGAWSEEEDALLVSLIKRNLDLGHEVSWTSVSLQVQGRSAKQCRERWCYSLDPSISKEPWSQEEDKTLLDNHATLGNRWAQLSSLLPGRTENDVKTRYKSIIRAKNREWSAEEDEVILRLHQQYGSQWEVIAEALPKRSKNAVKNRHRALKDLQQGKQVSNSFGQYRARRRPTSTGSVGSAPTSTPPKSSSFNNNNNNNSSSTGNMSTIGRVSSFDNIPIGRVSSLGSNPGLSSEQNLNDMSTFVRKISAPDVYPDSEPRKRKSGSGFEIHEMINHLPQINHTNSGNAIDLNSLSGNNTAVATGAGISIGLPYSRENSTDYDDSLFKRRRSSVPDLSTLFITPISTSDIPPRSPSSSNQIPTPPSHSPTSAAVAAAAAANSLSSFPKPSQRLASNAFNTYLGVVYSSQVKKWGASVFNKDPAVGQDPVVFVGFFDTAEEAAKARDREELRIKGVQRAHLNFPLATYQ